MVVWVGIRHAMTGDLAQGARGRRGHGIQPFTGRCPGQFAIPFGITFLLAVGHFLTVFT